MGTCQIASTHVNQSDYYQRLLIIPTRVSKYFKPEQEVSEGGGDKDRKGGGEPTYKEEISDDRHDQPHYHHT